LYIFGGYNNVIGLHFNDLHEFNPLTSSWQRIITHGLANPVPRRRQCCIVIDNRMYMFGGTSPVSTPALMNNLNDIPDIDGFRTRLYDQNDLYVFEFSMC
jgi:N-acetylneuraminic acid mutarotase